MYSSNEPMDPAEATKLINELVRVSTAAIRITSHCQSRMLQRGIDFQDLLLLLANGVVSEPPQLDPRYGQYKYRVQGPTVDGDEATAITVILEDPTSLLIVTVY